MGGLQEIFRTHGPRYLERFGATMPQAHKQVIEAIAGCRSSANGAIVYQCEGCGEQQFVPRCCGNRHCPLCQQGKAFAWLEHQLERQLPTPYFMLTFTVPEQLRPFLRRHQRIGYGALFEASAGAIRKLAPDPNYLGADTVHAPLFAACAAARADEAALLRLSLAQLLHADRGGEGAHRDGQWLCRSRERRRDRAPGPGAVALSALRRGAALCAGDPAATAFGDPHACLTHERDDERAGFGIARRRARRRPRHHG